MTDSQDDGPEAPGDEELSLPTRKQLFEHVKANPGIHFSQLKRDLDMETGLLQHHLRELDEEEKTILAVLRYETTRDILLYLLEHGPARNSDIAEAVGVTPATISWHLSNLTDGDVVESIQDGRTTRYKVTNEELTVNLLVRYQESFVDRAVDRIIDFWG